MVPGLRDTYYKDRLKDLKLPSLTHRRISKDMIVVFKLVNDMYYFDCTNPLTFPDQAKKSLEEIRRNFSSTEPG